jgi:hypothetical protein
MNHHLIIIMAAGLLNACGVVGAPVAPETVGIAPTIERQKAQHEALDGSQRTAAESEELDPSLQGQDEILPPLRPVGTR